ncbi:pentatricopeptide repeat (PPR) superfamily protein [Actinidia rufa]|uniref:Pentatricopeptide repeat (PPR) superfamily protein n=1 Tax=Actinidia rufa TaxID=165716 RepID=A0A7J0GC49_9ERIC|nr:pentatricopeptide repeat (PPR) superfamily protein [Actinidia rufa]
MPSSSTPSSEPTLKTSHSKQNSVYYYRLMLEYGVLPNKFTYPFVLKACAGIGNLILGKQVHGSVVKIGFDSDVHVGNTMVHMYCCCGGGIEFAQKVFDEMPKSDSVSWSAMIGGYARLGMSTDAVGLFREMQVSGVLWSLGNGWSLILRGKKVPKCVELCNALIDMFAKCGDVDKALKLFRDMNGKTIVSWTSVIVGMAMHGRGLEAVSLFEEMREGGMVPDDVVFIGEVMEKRGMQKIPGSTKIELDNEIYEFVAGDKTHNHYKEIYEMVDEMGREMKRAGYRPTTSEVLLDIDDEDKEDALNRHSEKLAIAFALLKTPPGTPIRIVKNLRVCADCHSATKFISKVYNREIVVRDRNRFHHFSDGKCSSGVTSHNKSLSGGTCSFLFLVAATMTWRM